MRGCEYHPMLFSRLSKRKNGMKNSKRGHLRIYFTTLNINGLLKGSELLLSSS
jgi:hypothetical protein